MKKLHVTVTRNDLLRAIPGDPMRCAVARSLNRLVDAEGFPHTFVSVGHHAVWLSSGGGPTWLGWLPGIARDAIQQLDLEFGIKVEPFEFDLELHEPGTPVPDPTGRCPNLREMLRKECKQMEEP